MRTFETGATRDSDEDKLDFEGFLSPAVLTRYAEYLHKHRKQADGNLRASDNWQQGIPLNVYMKSGFRHFMDWWTKHRGGEAGEEMEEALCALIFNAMGYLHELLKHKAPATKARISGTDNTIQHEFRTILSLCPDAEDYIVDNPTTMRRELHRASGGVQCWMAASLVNEGTFPGKPFGYYPKREAPEGFC